MSKHHKFTLPFKIFLVAEFKERKKKKPKMENKLDWHKSRRIEKSLFVVEITLTTTAEAMKQGLGSSLDFRE